MNNNDYIQLESKYTSGVYGKRDVVFVRGYGSRLWDADGREYIDCAAGIGVANVGHAHPVLTQAITAQAQTLMVSPELAYNDRRAELLARLVSLLPAGLERLFLCNSGSEAVEGAIKFARLSTGRKGVVATMRGFHGRTLGALSATHKPQYREPFLPLLPGFTHVPFGNVEHMEAMITADTAAVLVEIVQGEGGVRPGTAAYFQAVRHLCDQRGALFIVDEVQTGYGRTGRWFACEHMGIVPDLLCLGKAMAGGVPMGAVAIGTSVRGLTPGVHGSTFGGNPLACTAALATLDIIEQEKLTARAAELGHYLQAQLRRINSPLIRDVRGLGLMVGIDLKVRVVPILQALLARGVLALNAGPTVIRLLPPLIITQDELDLVVTALADILHEAPEAAELHHTETV